MFVCACVRRGGGAGVCARACVCVCLCGEGGREKRERDYVGLYVCAGASVRITDSIGFCDLGLLWSGESPEKRRGRGVFPVMILSLLGILLLYICFYLVGWFLSFFIRMLKMWVHVTINVRWSVRPVVYFIA